MFSNATLKQLMGRLRPMLYTPLSPSGPNVHPKLTSQPHLCCGLCFVENKLETPMLWRLKMSWIVPSCHFYLRERKGLQDSQGNQGNWALKVSLGKEDPLDPKAVWVNLGQQVKLVLLETGEKTAPWWDLQLAYQHCCCICILHCIAGGLEMYFLYFIYVFRILYRLPSLIFACPLIFSPLNCFFS